MSRMNVAWENMHRPVVVAFGKWMLVDTPWNRGQLHEDAGNRFDGRARDTLTPKYDGGNSHHGGSGVVRHEEDVTPIGLAVLSKADREELLAETRRRNSTKTRLMQGIPI